MVCVGCGAGWFCLFRITLAKAASFASLIVAVVILRLELKMNRQFKDYVTSGAFTLTLSPRQIRVLLHLNGAGPEDERLNLAPYQALERRGLAKFTEGKGYAITEEGTHVAALLILAEY